MEGDNVQSGSENSDVIFLLIQVDDDDTLPDEFVEVNISKAKQRLSVQRGAVSAEVYGLFNKKEDYKQKVIPKTEEQNQRIKTRISQSFLFSSLEPSDLAIIISAMEEKHYEAGETVIEQGQAGDCLYAVEHGELDCFKKIVNS